MAYDVDMLYEDSLKIVEREDVVFIHELVDYLPCVRSTFYEIFGQHPDKSDNIKKLIDRNKTKKKKKLRDDMELDGRSSERIFLYKLLANEDELKAVNGHYVDHSNKDGSMSKQIELSQEDKSEIAKSISEKINDI